MANTSKRGFASMDPSKQREIASKGGRAAHAKGTAHEFTPDEARVAGRKGGEAVSRDRQHMSAIGREGGHSRGRARQEQNRSSVGSSASQSGAISSSESHHERPSYFGQERGSDRGPMNQNTGGGLSSNRNEGRSGEENTSRDHSGRGSF
jgi:general stress protein YciG